MKLETKFSGEGSQCPLRETGLFEVDWEQRQMVAARSQS